MITLKVTKEMTLTYSISVMVWTRSTITSTAVPKASPIELYSVKESKLTISYLKETAIALSSIIARVIV